MGRAAHYRTEQIGLRLVNHLAPAVTVALELLQRQRNIADGWPTRGETAGRGTSDHTIPEAAILEAERIDLELEKITDTIESIEISVSHLAKLVIGIDRTPAALEEPRCREGQRGRDALRWSDDEACPVVGTKLGMCGKHYMQYYRFRVAHRLPVEQYFEKAASNAS